MASAVRAPAAVVAADPTSTQPHTGNDVSTSVDGRDAVVAVTTRLIIRKWRPQYEDLPVIIMRLFADDSVTKVFPLSWSTVRSSRAVAEQWVHDRMTEPGATYFIERRPDGDEKDSRAACDNKSAIGAPSADTKLFSGRIIGLIGALPIEMAFFDKHEHQAQLERQSEAAATICPPAGSKLDCKRTETTVTSASVATNEAATATVDAHGMDWGRLEIGYILERPAWGCGYATEATRALIRFCFEQYKTPSTVKAGRSLPCRELYGWTDPAHTVSVNVLIKAGMKPHPCYTNSTKAICYVNRSVFDLPAPKGMHVPASSPEPRPPGSQQTTS